MRETHFQIRAFPNKSLLLEEITGKFLTTLEEVLQKKGVAHVCLEGGTMSELALSRIAMYSTRANVLWNRVHFWWSDERFLPEGNAQRNYEQAKRCLFSRVKVPERNIHQIPFMNGDILLAVRNYTEELQKMAALGNAQSNGSTAPISPSTNTANHNNPISSNSALNNTALNNTVPNFDILFLGMGPDGHTASLFPNMRHPDVPVVPVFNSPKPPPERISMTLGAINNADRIWVELSGLEKAAALKIALEGADPLEIPIAGVRGRLETVIFADKEAASLIPSEAHI